MTADTGSELAIVFTRQQAHTDEDLSRPGLVMVAVVTPNYADHGPAYSPGQHCGLY